MSIDDTLFIRDRFVDLQKAEENLENLRTQKQIEIDAIITPEIKGKLAELDIQYGPKFTELNTFVAYINNEVKTKVLEGKVSVKGACYQAVYTKGRVTWDSKALSGYALAHPEINELRKTGKPSVSIRRNKE